jgi:HSP20 family protein
MAEPVPVRQGERRPARRGDMVPAWQSPRREMDELWDRVARTLFHWPEGSGWSTGGWTLPVDVAETDDAYVFEVELPGVRKEDIQVEVGEQGLSVTGEVKQRERVGVLRDGTRRTGGFAYRAALPAGVDPDRVEARVEDGVLTVRLPRGERAEPRQVTTD